MLTSFASAVVTSSTVPVTVVGEPPHDWWFYLSILFAFFTVVQAAIYFWQLSYQKKLFEHSKTSTDILLSEYEFRKEAYEADRPRLIVKSASWIRLGDGTPRRSLRLQCTFENVGARPAIDIKARAVYVRAVDINLQQECEKMCAGLHLPEESDNLWFTFQEEASQLWEDYDKDPHFRFRWLENKLRQILSVTDYEFNDPSSDYYRGLLTGKHRANANLLRGFWSKICKLVRPKSSLEQEYVEPVYGPHQTSAKDYLKNELERIGRVNDSIGNELIWRKGEKGNGKSGVCDSVSIVEIPVIRPGETSAPVPLIDLDIWQLTANDAKDQFSPPEKQCAIYWTAVHNDSPRLPSGMGDTLEQESGGAKLSTRTRPQHVKIVSPYSGADAWIKVDVAEPDLAFLKGITS